MTNRFCSNCGHPLSASARFCPNCGAETADAPAVAEPVVDDPSSRERVPWRAVEGIGIFIVAIIPTIPLAVALAATRCDRFVGLALARCEHHRDVLTALTVGVNELALLATVLLWVRLMHKRSFETLGFRRLTPINALIGLGVGIAGLFVAGIISLVLTTIVHSITHRTVEAPKQIPVQASPGSLVLIIIGFSVIVLAPLAEEAFFRGFVLKGLQRWAKPGLAIVLSAAIFGVAHLIPLIILPIFGLGVLLASIVEARGSLVPSIFAHATFNAIGFVELFHAHIRFG